MSEYEPASQGGELSVPHRSWSVLDLVQPIVTETG